MNPGRDGRHSRSPPLPSVPVRGLQGPRPRRPRTHSGRPRRGIAPRTAYRLVSGTSLWQEGRAVKPSVDSTLKIGICSSAGPRSRRAQDSVSAPGQVHQKPCRLSRDISAHPGTLGSIAQRPDPRRGEGLSILVGPCHMQTHVMLVRGAGQLASDRCPSGREIGGWQGLAGPCAGTYSPDGGSPVSPSSYLPS